MLSNIYSDSLIPLIKEKKLKIHDIIIDSKSGISGAGKQPRIENLFSEISGNFFSYGIESHKHYPEIDQEIRLINKKVSFTFVPHVLPIISGIQSTIYLEKEFDEKEYYKTIKISMLTNLLLKFIQAIKFLR